MKFKKLLALILALCMLLPTVSLSASAAISIDKGLTALRKQWSRGEGPKVSGIDIDYSYFSPVDNGASKSKKYPLIVLLPGFGEGTYEGEELTANKFAYWSAAENQKNAHNGGAYLLIARAPEEGLMFWDTAPVAPLKAAIEDFAAKNKYVDTKRIYIGGWSLGANGAIRAAIAYNDFFAGVFPMSPRYSISDSEAVKLKNTAVWLFGCISDVYSIYGATTGPSWVNLKSATANKSNIRLTKCTSAPIGGAFLNHGMWQIVINDFKSTSGYSGLSTVDGNGNAISSPKVLSWLTSRKLNQADDEDNNGCSCNCHSNNIIVKFIWKIQLILYHFSGNSSKRTCVCGSKHW